MCHWLQGVLWARNGRQTRCAAAIVTPEAQTKLAVYAVLCSAIRRSVYFELDALAMDDDRAYVLRRRNKDGVDGYLPVNTFTVQTYRYGLRAGDQLRLRHLLPHHDDSGPRGSARKPGEIWTVLTGSSDDPEALWLREPDGTLYSWSDDDSIFESFEKLPGV